MELNTLRLLELPQQYTLPYPGYEEGYKRLWRLRLGKIDLKRLVTREGSNLGERAFNEVWENRHLIPDRFKREIGGTVVGLCFMSEKLEDDRANTVYPFMYWRDGQWHKDNFYEDGWV